MRMLFGIGPAVTAPARRAFTTIELAIVLVLAAAIAAITIPSILPAMRKSAVNKAADSILAVAEEARRRARALEVPDSGFSLKDGTAGTTIRARGYDYGVKVEVPADSSSAAIVYLIDSSYAKVMDSTTGKPVMQRSLGSNVLPFATVPIVSGNKLRFTPMGSGASVTWFYKRGTGQCCTIPVTNPKLAEIGTGVQSGGSPDFEYHSRLGLTTASIPAIATPDPTSGYGTPYFGVCSIDGRYGVGIAIFCSGLGYSQEIASGQ